MKIEFYRDYDLFRSDACHKLKQLGDLAFIEAITKSNIIEDALFQGMCKESLYLLSMIEYLCRVHGIAVPNKYGKIAKLRLKKTAYPGGIIMLALTSRPNAKEEAAEVAIPEFLRHNIVEDDIRNAY